MGDLPASTVTLLTSPQEPIIRMAHHVLPVGSFQHTLNALRQGLHSGFFIFCEQLPWESGVLRQQRPKQEQNYKESPYVGWTIQDSWGCTHTHTSDTPLIAVYRDNTWQYDCVLHSPILYYHTANKHDVSDSIVTHSVIILWSYEHVQLLCLSANLRNLSLSLNGISSPLYFSWGDPNPNPIPMAPWLISLDT